MSLFVSLTSFPKGEDQSVSNSEGTHKSNVFHNPTTHLLYSQWEKIKPKKENKREKKIKSAVLIIKNSYFYFYSLKIQG
jgi:hypothetical protein